MVAVEGKALHGSGVAGDPGRQLLAALDHVHGVVLGQVDVEAKTNEIPMFATLLDRVGLAAAVVTADAMNAQRGHAVAVRHRASVRCRSISPAMYRTTDASSAVLPGRIRAQNTASLSVRARRLRTCARVIT